MIMFIIPGCIVVCLAVLTLFKGLTCIFPLSGIKFTSNAISFMGELYPIYPVYSNFLKAYELDGKVWKLYRSKDTKSVIGLKIKDVSIVEGDMMFNVLVVRSSDYVHTFNMKISKSNWQSLFGTQTKVKLFD